MTALATMNHPAPAVPNPELLRALAAEMARELVTEQAAQDPRNRVLVSEIFAAFLADKQKRFDQGRLGADGFYQYKLRCRQFLEWKGDGPVSRCRQEDFESWCASHPDWGKWTIIQATTSISGVFRWATWRGLVATNPYPLYIKKPSKSVARTIDPTEEPSEQEWTITERGRKRRRRRGSRLPKFLRWDQALKIMAYCDEQVKHARTQRQRYEQMLQAKQGNFCCVCGEPTVRKARTCGNEKCHSARERGRARLLHPGNARKLEAYELDAMIIRVGFYLGVRISEIMNLDVTDVDLQERTCMVREGKGSVDRCVRIPDNLLPHLAAWIGKRTNGALLHRKGKRLCKETLYHRIVRAAKLAGIAVHVNPHMLRHTYAMRLLDTGATVTTVQHMLGHSSVAVTGIYLHADPSRFARDVDGI